MLDWLKLLWFNWRLNREVISPNAKCRACGAFNGSIHWGPYLEWLDGTKGGVVHTCKICSATWAEKPIFASKDWAIAAVEDQTLASFPSRPVPKTIAS